MKSFRIVDLSRRLVRLAVVAAMLAATFFVSVSPARSADTNRYVSPDGADSSNCSDPLAPCETIEYALGQAEAGDVILLDAGVYEENLTIDKNITIRQNPEAVCTTDPCVAIDGTNSGRVIDIPIANTTVYLETIAVQNGAVTDENGAGIKNNGTLKLDGVIVRENHVLSPSDYEHSGGGIANFRILEVQNSKIYNNSGYDGGGIYARTGTLTVQNSEIYSNTATRNGGGISIPWGYASSIVNTTIWGNQAKSGGGVYIYDLGGYYDTTGEHFFGNVTISGNTASTFVGGLHSTVHVELNHCTLAMNDGPGVSDLYLSENHRKEEEPAPGTPPQSSIYNSIIANTGTEKVCGMSTTARNLTLSNGGNITTDSSCGFEESTDLQNTDPRLASLADNGGPVQTHALLANSPAIDHAFPIDEWTDARGVAPQDGDGDGLVAADSGAYEYAPPDPPPGSNVFLPMVIR